MAQSTLRRPGEAQASGDLTEGPSVEKPEKRRISGDRAALGVTQEEAYYQAPSLGGGTGVSAFLTTIGARIDRQVAYPAAKQRAKAASSASWSGHEEWKETKSLEVGTKTGAIVSITWDRGDEGTRDALSPGSAARRRHAIHYFFVEVFGAPEEEDWAAPNFHLRLSLPRVIMDMLNIPATSKARVITTMKAIIDAHEAKKEYDPSAAIKAGGGAKVLIEDYTPQAEVVYRVMESGMSLGSTVVVLNQWRRRRTLEPISYGFMQRFVRSSAVRVLEKRETIKSGSKDEGTTWAWARCQFAQQLKRQFRKGARIAAGGSTYVAAEDGDDPAQVALELHIFRGGVVFGDEHHRKTTTPTATHPGSSARGRPRRCGTSHGADLEGRGHPHQRAHHGGHLGVGAGVRQDHRGQGHYRPQRELPDGPPCAEDARRGGT